MPPEIPEQQDPITSQSLSKWLALSALLMMAALAWALYDEYYGLRPWKQYEADFSVKYAAFLKKQKPKQEAAEKAVKASPEYRAIEQQMESLQKSLEPQLQQLDAQA